MENAPIHHVYPGYDIKRSDGVAPAMLELWVILNTP